MDNQNYQNKQAQYGKTILTTDAVVLRGGDVLLITRGRGAHVGKYALPGGKVDYNEDPEDTCLRELFEETGIQGESITLAAVKGAPGRDPRGHFVTIVYRVTTTEDAVPKG